MAERANFERKPIERCRYYKGGENADNKSADQKERDMAEAYGRKNSNIPRMVIRIKVGTVTRQLGIWHKPTKARSTLLERARIVRNRIPSPTSKAIGSIIGKRRRHGRGHESRQGSRH